MDNGWPALIVFLLRNPHLLEGGEGGQDGTTNPDRVFALRRRNDFDFHRRRRKGSDLFLHSVRDARIHSGTARLKKVSSGGDGV